MKPIFILLNILFFTSIGCNNKSENSRQNLSERGMWIYSDFGKIGNRLYDEFILLQLNGNKKYRLVKRKTGLPDSLYIRPSIDSGVWYNQSDTIYFVNDNGKSISSKFKIDSCGKFSIDLYPDKQFISADSFFKTYIRTIYLNVKIVAGDIFGYAASPSEFYLSMELLNDFGDSLKFADLIKSANPAIRVMGAILSLKHMVNKELVENLIFDTTALSFSNFGCVLLNRTVGDIVKEAYMNPDFLRNRK